MHPKHFPANPDRFEFDAAVTAVFPDMAARSIPNFHSAHRMHAQIAAAQCDPGFSVLDVGASRGAFLEHLHRECAGIPFFYTAVDSSASMCDRLRAEFEGIDVLGADVTTSEFHDWLKAQPKFDVICCNYVLQFLSPTQQVRVLVMLADAVSDRGLFFLGHKSAHGLVLGAAAHEAYIGWRVENGYTREEIEAKTKALAGSMFPMDHSFVLGIIRRQFREVQETTRFAMFSTVAALK